MRSVRDRTRELLHVTIVSANAETLDGLQTYLRQAGVDARGTREIAIGRTDPRPSTVVFFPDDYLAEDVLREVGRLRRTEPQVLVILVTREPHRFAEALDPDESSTRPIIVPKPVWGWIILDAIRGRLKAPDT